MTRSESIKFVALRSLGNFLVLFALYGVVATFGPVLFYEAQFQLIKIRGINFKVVQAEEKPKAQGFADVIKLTDSTSYEPSFADILAGSKEQVLVPVDTNFSIVIPKIGASSRIIPNVDPVNKKEFLPVLQRGIAHARGTVFPGMKGSIYLFAHSTDNFWNVGRYNAVFYLLKDLVINDDIVIFFENRRYNYTISETKVVDAEDVSYLVDAQKGDGQNLILQTCWPPGTTWKRLIVVAKPKV